ncbi:MAG: phage tail sheath subtilisin-like domain-containing protein [Burkholderiaceae bacterium]|jgi:phage tail sheath gpL-like|uniref:phage tail sheath subtilisin-like domain-containing protein n=1 Tax=unclassified Polaromonas TaxID=2638319 RepID=UPI000BD13B91|nr:MULTISPECIES: phage tail sheath subtilisin-like domain-containing protein [unclassified Polaromonas]MDO8776200.1 phage tail sheath subtilisin-like domain-containing protein [Burkholderiaceae bacterium]OYY32729.1 MAG: phage tail protein [Polaromonas sp. 35-63-35]OYZ15108.1 MAG: phage tail protein [Polaromonas sp. 16-63-31]OYZ75495.1 MAG: phage tail protein [Polaromonas sp. 24-63-21]OZA53004.1 MAG: phage tail protein [Polaromonas sp. 17-63-33]
MPDNIAFNTIPIDVRTPGQYLEVDNSKAVRGLPAMNRRMLFIGNKLAAGSAAALTLQRINSPAEAAALFGRGSVLHEMLVIARNANKESDIWAMGLADDVAGTAATKTLTVTGPATEAGTLALYINGVKITVGVALNDAATVVATAIAAAVNARLDAPVTAAAALAVVTLTARHKGAFTNDIDARINYYPDEKTPAGVAIVIAAGVAGAGNPDVAPALAAISLEAYYTIATPYNDASNVVKLETELAARWGGMDMRTGHLFIGMTGTHAALTTYGAARNSPHSTVMGVKSAPSPSYHYAAALAAVCEFSGAIDPARPFQTLNLPGLLPPALGDRFTRQERDLLLRDGISTFLVDQGGNVLIERVVTTYQVNAYGIDDVSYLDLETKWTVDYMRFAFRARIALRFPRHKLADDGTSFSPGQAVATPNIIRGELLDVARQLELVGVLEGFEQFKNDLVVVRSLVDTGRVNCILPPNVVNQFRVFAASVQFIL